VLKIRELANGQLKISETAKKPFFSKYTNLFIREFAKIVI